MRLTTEIATNPGPKAWFVAEVVLEKSAVPRPGYWGVHLGWWAMRPFRDWLWEKEWDMGTDCKWSICSIRLLGFEVMWERRAR